MAASTFSEILKFNPYHDRLGRFSTANAAASFTYAPGKSTSHDAAIQREKEGSKDDAGKGFKGTLYHGSPETDIEEFDMSRAGSNTSSGEKLLFFTDSKEMAEDFSYERLEGSSKFLQRRGKKGRVYEVDVEMENPLDFRNLSDKDIDNILKLDMDGLLTKDMVQSFATNHQLLKASLNLTAESLKELGYDGFIANTGKAGHNSLEYAVVDSKQAKIRKSDSVAKTFDEIVELEKFNPYHDRLGRFSSANSAASFTSRTKDPNKQHMADAARAREQERHRKRENDTPREKTLHTIEDDIRNQNYETAAVVDKDGNTVFVKDGQQSQVGFNFRECGQMRGNILTHNHPRCSMFSDEDLTCFARNAMFEIRATNRDGTTYSMKRGGGYTDAKSKEFIDSYKAEYKKSTAFAQAELDRRGFADKIFRGEITHAEANREFARTAASHMADFCEKNAAKYGMTFSVEQHSVAQKAFKPYREVEKAMNEEFIIDKDSEQLLDDAFNEWLNAAQAKQKTEKSFSIYKTEDDKRLVFGWASVSIKVDGEQLEDRQEDMIDPEDLEAAAYEYVLNFRDTGEEHIKTMRKKGKLVESCVFTEEKQRAMGIPPGILPVAWWIGFKINDDDAWEKVKNGTYKMFSIEGRANREPVEKADVDIDKRTYYRDKLGRFASPGTGSADSGGAVATPANVEVSKLGTFKTGGLVPNEKREEVEKAIQDLPGCTIDGKPLDNTDGSPTQFCMNPIPYIGSKAANEIDSHLEKLEFDPWDDEHSSFYNVKVSEVKANQDNLERSNLGKILNRDRAGFEFAGSEICIVKRENQYITYDGNHRTALAKLGGKETVLARVYDMDAKTAKKSFQTGKTFDEIIRFDVPPNTRKEDA